MTPLSFQGVCLSTSEHLCVTGRLLCLKLTQSLWFSFSCSHPCLLLCSLLSLLFLFHLCHYVWHITCYRHQIAGPRWFWIPSNNLSFEGSFQSLSLHLHMLYSIRHLLLFLLICSTFKNLFVSLYHCFFFCVEWIFSVFHFFFLSFLSAFLSYSVLLAGGITHRSYSNLISYYFTTSFQKLWMCVSVCVGAIYLWKGSYGETSQHLLQGLLGLATAGPLRP